ncbi:hypothetical protein [Bacillus toyonensis]|uniref:hypothetical protein n=1 Tax=Bacillus toyonensis TaxID=155322 RepID=UPI002E1DAF58|nr:hypothetical protein [Bacillus toyonensis]
MRKQYKWEKESLHKYGQEATSKLIKEQQKFEEQHKDNDCNRCGKGNEGSIVEWVQGKPMLTHYGVCNNGYCEYCGKHK